MGTTRTPDICSNFSAKAGDTVAWTNIPSNCNYAQQNCSVTKADTDWPFNQGPPIYLPNPSTITLKSGLTAGDYDFNVSCCSGQEATKSVTIVVSFPKEEHGKK